MIARFFIGTLMIVGALAYAHHLEKKALAENHIRYVKCLATGEKPVVCSFNAAFRRDY